MNTADTKTRILDAAQELIQCRGINGMSYQDLAAAVGIRKASIHHHFPAKLDMLNALLDRYIREFETKVTDVLGAKVTGRTKLKRYFELFQTTLNEGQRDKACLCGMLIAEMASLNEQGLQKVRKFLQSNANHIHEILKNGIADGSFTDQKNTRATADMVLASLEGGLLIARCEGGPKRLETILNQMMQLLSN